MGGGKGSSPPPPDYSGVAASNEAAAKIQAQTAADQLDWAKEQYKDQAPYTKSFMDAMTATTANQTQQARDQQQRMEGTYWPLEDQFTATAKNYATPQRTAERSAQAQADVANAYSGQRSAALQNLESFGIDPSQTRYGALDLGTRIGQAANMAAAGTQSRLGTEATGMGLLGEAINIGAGYPSNIAQSYATATGAGQAGVNSGINTSSSFGNLMGTPIQYGQLANQSNQGAVQAMNSGYQNQLAGFNANAAIGQNQASGIGSMVGGLAAAGMMAVAV